MGVVRMVRRLLGRTDEEGETYRCIRCGDEFDTDYHDCPSCGQPYVAEIDS